MVILTEDLILKKCNEDIDVDEINLSNLQITEIDPTAFKNFASLHTINLKNNQLRHLPKDLEFASPEKWWRLDLTNNRLNGYDSLEPLFSLTNFEELLVEDNIDISVEDEHKIQFKIPTLRRINDKPVDTGKLTDSLTLELEIKMLELWKKNMMKLWKKFGNTGQVVSDFSDLAVKTIRTANNSIKRFVVWRLTEDILPTFLDKYSEDPNLLKEEVERYEATRPMKRSITPTNEVESKFGKTDSEAEFKIDNVVQSNTRQQLVKECKRAKTILARKKDDVQEMYGIDNRDEYIKSRWTPLYQPEEFLRIHGTATDANTQIWSAKFDPENQKLLASAGGNKVIFTDVPSKTAVSTFTIEQETNIYSLCWFKQNGKYMLAVGGGDKGNVYFVDIASSRCFGNVKNIHKSCVNEILFTSREGLPEEQCVMLTCGMDVHSNRYQVVLTDVQIEADCRRYSSQVMCTFSVNPAGNPIRMLRVCNSLWLGCEDTPGVLVYSDKFKKAMKRESAIKSTTPCDYILHWDNVTPSQMTIDGMCAITDDGLVALKISASTKLMNQINGSSETGGYNYPGMILIVQFYEWNKEADVFRKLDFSNTTEIYMNISFVKNISLLLAGDENGNIWMYDLMDVVERANKLSKNKVDADENTIFPADGIVPFPLVKYNGSTLEQDTSKLQINCIATTSNGSYVVAASNCNMLCVYKPNPQLDIQSEVPTPADPEYSQMITEHSRNGRNGGRSSSTEV